MEVTSGRFWQRRRINGQLFLLIALTSTMSRVSGWVHTVRQTIRTLIILLDY